ncbi:PE-PPE domain-containing protein [Mycobacterium riyadhense]|uniref:Putative PPE family protein PPE42 n=1 Tax=Mycobacterium riyadhense TaxID=486698 RepID=A0A653EH08_9MYCO|nr:PE-PPE domain-containing protein [Mycobacterium riyadhense]VTO96756.1 putative PPE family protein PPE42 [Mycobacterium riyadhense]
MSFAVLPPELNSARMFAGVGPGPMLAAAAAWDGVAEELHAAAGTFTSATAGLAGEAWRGPASVAMTGAAGPYVGWLSTAADQAEQVAGQARLIASAFEAALAATVHPAIIGANRTQLVSLVAANLLGQNAPAIAAAEAEYEQIWAQDVAAMSAYFADASAVVGRLAPWQQLLQNLQSQTDSAYAATGLGATNLGTANIGSGNIGVGNVGNGNIGVGNVGDGNIGLGNRGNWNIGIANTGNNLIGFARPGDGNVGVALINLGQVGAGVPAKTALLMGGTGLSPLPGPNFAATVEPLLTPTHPSYIAQFVVTPLKFFPFTGPASLTLDASVAQGVQNLHAAIMAQDAAGNHTVVFGVSQSATIATLEMRFLQTLPAGLRPGPDELSFVLAANPDRPNGGLLARLPGFSIPSLGFTFYGATPANLYPTTDYAIQYDGAADFPQFPINLIADANAIAGFLFLHPYYNTLTPAQIASGVVQPVSPDSLTTYILIPSDELPLLIPLRAVPILGSPLAELIEPDLRVLVELGYDRTAYQDVPTPFGLFPNVDPATVMADLQQGAVEGIHNALAELGYRID